MEVRSWLTYVLIIMVGCGGVTTIPNVDELSDTDRKILDLPPLASAGADQMVLIATKVYLNAQGSYHPQKKSVTYKWQQIIEDGQPHVSLSNPRNPSPSFIAPLETGVLEFQLEVSDGTWCTTDLVKVHVGGGPLTFGPVLYVGEDRSANNGLTPSMTDIIYADEGMTNIAWSKIEPVLCNVISVKSSLDTEAELDQNIEYYRVEGVKDRLDSAPDFLGIYKTKAGIIFGDSPPVAGAVGPINQVSPGDSIILDARYSVEPNNQILTYHWYQVWGEPVLIEADRSNSVVSFIAPRRTQNMVFIVQVSDGFFFSSPHLLRFAVDAGTDNIAPVAKTGISPNTRPGRYVYLNAENSSDADSDELQYNWEQTMGTSVDLRKSRSARSYFIAPEEPTVLAFVLTVDDGIAVSNPAVQLVHVVDDDHNSAPLLTYYPGDELQVDAQTDYHIKVQVSDPEGDDLRELECTLDKGLGDISIANMDDYESIDGASWQGALSTTTGHAFDEYQLTFTTGQEEEHVIDCSICDEFQACSQKTLEIEIVSSP